MKAERERRENDVAALQTALRKQTEQRKELGRKLTAASSRERATRDDLEHVLVEYVASVESMSRQCLQLVDEAISSAAAEGRVEQQRIVQELKTAQLERQRSQSRQVTALQRQLQEETGKFMRLEASVADMIEETAEQCRAEWLESVEAMKERHASELESLRKRHAQKQRRLSEEVAGAQAQRDIAQAATARAHIDAQANISAATVAAAAKVDQFQRAATAALDEARRAYLQLSQPADSLHDAAARLVGGAADSYLTPNTGAQASTAADLGRRSQQALTSTAVNLIKTVIELGAPGADIPGFAALVGDNREFNHMFKRSGASSRRVEQLTKLEANVINAIRVFTEQKDSDKARQLLSLFPPSSSGGYSARDVASMCSQHSVIEVGMPVLITVPGNQKQYGVVRAFEEDGVCVVELLERSEAEKKKRHVTTVTAATAAFQRAAPSGEITKLKQQLCDQQQMCTLLHTRWSKL